jgi:serine/threonine protein kinase
VRSVVDENRLDGSSAPGALCSTSGGGGAATGGASSLCGATRAFSCPFPAPSSPCAAACPASTASLSATCNPTCTLPPSSPGVGAVAVAAACNASILSASCNECTLALTTAVVASGVAMASASDFGTCVTAPLPAFLAAAASPAVLDSALRSCAFMHRVRSNVTCPVAPPASAFTAAIAPCADPTSACNTCSARLVSILISAGLRVPELGLSFTTAHFEVVSNCLAKNVLAILAANVSATTLLRGFAYCTGPSAGWYQAVANSSLFTPPPAPPPRAADGGGGGGGGGAARGTVVGAAVGACVGAAASAACVALALRRCQRRRRVSNDGGGRHDALPRSRSGGTVGYASSASYASNSTSDASLTSMKPMLLGEELVLGELIGSGGYARVHRGAWKGTQVAVKCFEPLLPFAGLPPGAAAPALGLPLGLAAAPRGAAPAAFAGAGSEERSLPGSATSLLAADVTASPASSLPVAPPGLGPGGLVPMDKLGGLLQELNLLQSLRHPNVCAVYGLVLRPPMLVIELAPRGSLAALLRAASATSLPWPARVAIAAGTACGVEFLHAQSPPIIHRDLKSANVVLTSELVPKLCDFGLSRVLPVLASAAASTQAGTPQYMAPEVARGLPITRPTAIDTFGLGVVLHDLAHLGIAGRASLGANTALSAGTGGVRGSAGASGSAAPPVHVLYARAASDFAVTIGAHVAPPLAELMRACLAVEPAERPESADVRARLLEMAPASAAWTW